MHIEPGFVSAAKMRFGGSYVAVVALEPLLTIALLRFLGQRRAVPLVRLCLEDRRLA